MYATSGSTSISFPDLVPTISPSSVNLLGVVPSPLLLVSSPRLVTPSFLFSVVVGPASLSFSPSSSSSSSSSRVGSMSMAACFSACVVEDCNITTNAQSSYWASFMFPKQKLDIVINYQVGQG